MFLADEYPLTPLEFFRSEIGYNPWTFNGLITEQAVTTPQVLDQHVQQTPCNPVVKEWAWQGADAVGRSELRAALLKAEDLLETFLNYSIAPKYRSDEVTWPRLADTRMVRWRSVDADGKFLNIQLPKGYIQVSGVEARTVIQAGVAVTYTDQDLDGIKELATIGPIAYTGDPTQVAVYVPLAGRYGADTELSEQWRIQPVKVTPNGAATQITITLPSWLLVIPLLQAGVGAPDLIIDSAMTVFLQTVDVYRRYTTNGDTTLTAQAIVTWQTEPCHGWWCCCGCQSPSFSGNIYDPAATATAFARVGLRDARLGKVNAIESVYNTTTGEWSAVVPWGYDGCACSEPDRVLVRTLAGYPLNQNGLMDPKWRKLVSILAAAELGGGLSGCKEANRQMYYWQQDLAKTGNDREFYATSAKILNNPFGTRRGHVYVASQVIDGAKRQSRSILVP